MQRNSLHSNVSILQRLLFTIIALMSILSILCLYGCNNGSIRQTDTSTNSPKEAHIELTHPPHIDSSTFQHDPKVSLTLGAFDLQGNALSLAPQQVKIIEDGNIIPADQIEFRTGPVSIVLLFDVSGSMNRPAIRNASSKPLPKGSPEPTKKIEACRKAALELLNEMKVDDQVAIITFNQNVKIVSPFTNDKKLLRSIIEKISVPDDSGTTALLAALDSGLDLLEKASGRHNLIALTDGGDNEWKKLGATKEGVLRTIESKAQQRNVPLITIGYGDASIDPKKATAQDAEYMLDLPTLKELADTTGGKMLQTPDPEKLQALFGEATRQVQGSFPLIYHTPNSTVGRVHHIEVEVDYHGAPYRSDGSYSLGFLGSTSDVPMSNLNKIFWVIWLSLSVLGYLPFFVHWVYWLLRQRKFYSKFQDRGASARPGECSPISTVEFVSRPNELLIVCPVCRLRHLYTDWVSNNGCARGHYFMPNDIGLGLSALWYNSILIGALGGLMAWLASWSVLDPIIHVMPIHRANIWLTVTLGICVGLFVGMLDAIFQQLPLRALREGLMGAMMGMLAGIFGALAGEWIFAQVGWLPTWLPQEFLGRVLSWGVVGALIGMSQYLWGGTFFRGRLLRGLLGGLGGGATGGAIFQFILQAQPSPSFARLAFIVIGGLIAFGITFTVNNGRFWLVRISGNVNVKEFNLIRSERPISVGSDVSNSQLHLKDPHTVAPQHARLIFNGQFVIEDMSRQFHRTDGSAYPIIQVNSQPIRTHKILQHGDMITIGSVQLRFEERSQKSSSDIIMTFWFIGLLLLPGTRALAQSEGALEVIEPGAAPNHTENGWMFFGFMSILSLLLLFLPRFYEANSAFFARFSRLFVDRKHIYGRKPYQNPKAPPSGTPDIVINDTDISNSRRTP